MSSACVDFTQVHMIAQKPIYGNVFPSPLPFVNNVRYLGE